MLDTYQLQVFLAVVQAGSYTAAARRLHLTQPAVSRQIQRLQKQLGVRLFRRVGRGMLPTHAGERLIGTARKILALSQRVEEDLAGLRGEMVGVLRVAGSGAVAWYVLSRLLPAFRLACPGVGFQLLPLSPRDAGQALAEGRLDLLLSEETFLGRKLLCDLLVRMETVLVVPSDEYWKRRKRLPLRNLAKMDLILPARGTPARNFLEEYLVGREILLPDSLRLLEVQDPGAVLPLVAAGLGTALLPRPLLGPGASPVHALTLWPGFAWPLYLIRRANPLGRIEETFCHFALEEGPDLLR